MMSRKETINALRERLVSRAKECRLYEIRTAIAYATGYMPDMTLIEFDELIETLKNEDDIYLW